MKKEELKNWLLVKNENWSFYVKDSERKRIFVELLEDGFPSAIQLYFQAPRQFVEKYQEFQKVHFQYISELYFPMKYLPDGTMEEPKKTKEKQLQSYAETVKRIREEKQEGAIEFLKAELWAKCIDSLLDMCESYHNKRIKESKEDEKIFHQNCKENIKAMKEKRKQEREQAIAYFKKRDLEQIWLALLSGEAEEKQKKLICNLMKQYANELYTQDNFQKLEREYKLIAWVEVYIENLLLLPKKQRDMQLIISIMNSPVTLQISEKLITGLFETFDSNQQIPLFYKINQRSILELLLKYYTEKYNSPEETFDLIDKYLKRYPDSGEAIYHAALYWKNGRSLINSLPDRIEASARTWFLNYNFHKKEEEIADVIEALETVDRIGKLLIDFPFWTEMKMCDAFIHVIDNLALSMGFAECFKMIEQNYFAARAYGDSVLMKKWIQAANSLAVNNDDAREAYVYFIENLVSENSVLDTADRRTVFCNTLDFLLGEAGNNKKRLELEKEKVQKVRSETLEDIIHHICVSIEKLEKLVVTYGNMGTSREMQVIQNQIGKVRSDLQKTGIFPVAVIEDWTKQRAVKYNPAIQECSEEIAPDDMVQYLSMGMKNEEKSYFEKAAVKKYIGGEKHGGEL